MKGVGQKLYAPLKLGSINGSLEQRRLPFENALEELAGFLGPREVTLHSQDDKTKVPIGIKEASKQTPLLMHMQYKVLLPHYDYVVASQHKLIPSVIGDMQVRENEFSGDAVAYSGPT